MGKIKLHSYQEAAVRYILNNRFCGLFLDMGMGKTLSVLYALKVLRMTEGIGRVLIIAPKRVADMTWPEEISKWGFDFKYTKVMGNVTQRLRAINQDAEIYITNIEQLVWISDFWRFETVVLDEASLFKSTNTQRFKTMKKLRYKRLIALTGTPAPNNLTELWPLMYLLDHGLRLGRTVTKYRQTYFTKGYVNERNQVLSWDVLPGAADKIYAKISDICISMKNVKKPEVIYNNVYCHLDKSEMSNYLNLEANAFLEYEDSEIDAQNPAVLLNKLIQTANGQVYDYDKNAVHIHDRKIELLEEMIQQANGQNVLIFALYKHDIAKIIKRIKATQLINPEDFSRWNRGEINIAIAHPKTCGHGLNMQSGGHIICWYGLTWSLETYLQANARLARQGQKETVIINHLLTHKTVDDYVIQKLQNKSKNLKALINAVRNKEEEYASL